MLKHLLAIAITLLLVVSLVAANAAVAVDRGPMNEDRVTSEAEEADLYEHMQGEIVVQLEDELPELPFPGLEDQASTILQQTITSTWIQNESERNLGNLYGHMNNDDELEITIQVADLRPNAESALREALDSVSYEELGSERLDSLTAGEESFENEREQLRWDLLRHAGADPAAGFGHPILEDLVGGETSYEETREELRQDLIDEMMDEVGADEGFGYERLENMLESEESYEQERQDFRDDRKEQIQEETDEELDDEELEEAYEERQDEFIDEAANEAVAEIEVDDDEVPIEMDDHIDGIATLTGEALAGVGDREVSYDEFQDRYEQKVAAIEADIEDSLEEQPEKYQDDLSETIEGDFEETDIPGAVEDDTDDLINLTVEAVLSDMSYEEFDAEYQEIASELVDSSVEYIGENREEYDDEIGGAVDTEFDDSVSDAVEADVDAMTDHVIEAVLTDMTYEQFITELEALEDNLAISLTAFMFESEQGLPTTLDYTDEVNNSAGDELEMGQTFAGAVSILSLVLPLLAIGFVGLLYLVSGSVVMTSIATGIGSIIVGAGGLLVTSLASSRLAEAVQDAGGGDISAELLQAMESFIEGVLIAPLITQSQVLVVLGIGCVAVGAAIHLGVFEELRARIPRR